jgi:hypothetical protein
MKKPTLADALARKDQMHVTLTPASQESVTPAAKPGDSRIATTVRIDPEQLEALKIIAAKRRVRVNDLLLEGVAHILALYTPTS